MKSRSRRTAEEVCIEYHLAAAEIRRISAVIKAQVCQRDRDYQEALKTNPRADFPKQPCLSEYFALPRIEDEHGNLHMDDGDFEGFCEYCQIAYDAVQERKRARLRLGAAKRAVGAVGKRLNAEKAHDEEECDPDEVCPKCGEKGVAVGAYCHMVEEKTA